MFVHVVFEHNEPPEVLSNPDAENINGAFVKLRPFITMYADLLSPG